MDKNSERYKELCKNPKFERRAARLWYQAIWKNNRRLIFEAIKPPPMPDSMKDNK